MENQTQPTQAEVEDVTVDKPITVVSTFDDVVFYSLNAMYDLSSLSDKEKLIAVKGYQLANKDKDKYIRELIANDVLNMEMVTQIELLIRESDSFEHETISLNDALSFFN